MTVAILAGAAPAPAPEAVIRELVAADARVLAVSHRLQTRGVALCPRQDAEPGMTLHAFEQYAPALRPTVARMLSLRPGGLAVLATAPGGAAERAGVRPGDVLLAIGGTTVPAAGSAPDRLRATAALLRPSGAARVELHLARQGALETVVLALQPACRSRVQLRPSRRPRAWSDGQLVTVTSALLDFTRSDAELAFVLGHEIAHNALGHGKRGSRRARELAADALALRLMTAAGYPTSGVPAFVDRLYRGPAGGLFPSIGHLGRRERLRAIREELGRHDLNVAARQQYSWLGKLFSRSDLFARAVCDKHALA